MTMMGITTAHGAPPKGGASLLPTRGTEIGTDTDIPTLARRMQISQAGMPTHILTLGRATDRMGIPIPVIEVIRPRAGTPERDGITVTVGRITTVTTTAISQRCIAALLRNS
jgi:hypothetical protein